MTTAVNQGDFPVNLGWGSTAAWSARTHRMVRNAAASAGNIVLTTAVLLLALPILLLLWATFALSVWVLSRMNFSNVVFDLNNYKQYRLMYDALKELDDILSNAKPASRLDPFAAQQRKTKHIVQKHLADLSGKFTELDKPYDDLPPGWSILTSDERWKDRPTPYEYVI